jgi:hypothetical protein
MTRAEQYSCDEPAAGVGQGHLPSNRRDVLDKVFVTSLQ